MCRSVRPRYAEVEQDLGMSGPWQAQRKDAGMSLKAGPSLLFPLRLKLLGYVGFRPSHDEDVCLFTWPD